MKMEIALLTVEALIKNNELNELNELRILQILMHDFRFPFSSQSVIKIID